MTAAWLDEGRLIGLVTMGSSGCPPEVDGSMLDAEGSLAVTFAPPDPARACIADYAPRVSLIPVPADLDPAESLTITVIGDGFDTATELDGVDGLSGGGATSYAPSAGWTGVPGQFVLLTWGSSSCAPVIAEVAASGPAEITVTVETPPADQVCTMDMGPRATAAVVDGLEEDRDVTLVLTGSPEFDGVELPIVGEN